MVTRGNKDMSYYHALLTIYQPLTLQRGRSGIKLEKTFWFFSNFSTKPQFLYEGAIFLRKFNIKN